MHRAPLQPSAPTQEPTTPAAAQVQAQGHPQANNPAIPTSVAIDASWVVVGLANSRIQVFSARTGVLARTLVGHESGVWAVALVSARGAPRAPVPAGDPLVEGVPADTALPPLLRRAVGLEGGESSATGTEQGMGAPCDPFGNDARPGREPPTGKPSYPGGASDGWGQPNALVVSGGCDKELRVWDVKSG